MRPGPGSVKERYSRALVPLLLSRAVHPVGTLTPSAVLFGVGPNTVQWDTVAIVRHRSRRDFLDMITSSEYAGAEVHKWASVADTVVIVPTGGFLLDPRPLVLVALAVIGAAVAAAQRLAVGQRRET